MDRDKVWRTLLDEAVSEPGIVADCYSRFHDYSFGNRMLALVQCQVRGLEYGPINTYKGWQDLGRQVQKGEKAIELWMPFTVTKEVEEEAPEGEEPTVREVRYTYFKLLPRWFVLGQTDGDEFEMPDTPGWDYRAALESLEISEVPFEDGNGNVQGYAIRERRVIAINPIADHPVRTMIHEIAHMETQSEIEAEGVSYLVSSALGIEGAEESRGYIQHWIKHEGDMTEEKARRIITIAGEILEAGTVEAEELALAA